MLELALREALSLRHNYIGPEHILRGLVRENEGVSARILVDFGAGSEKIRNQVIGMLPAGGPQPASSMSTRPIDPGWFDGLGPVLNQLADEIRNELGREPDTGDVLLVLAAATGSLPARALEQLNVDGNELWAQIERLRSEARQAREQLAGQLEQARTGKERAIEVQEFQTAANHRDQERKLERKLTAQQRAQTLVPVEALETIRRRLGLPTPTDPPSATAD